MSRPVAALRGQLRQTVSPAVLPRANNSTPCASRAIAGNGLPATRRPLHATQARPAKRKAQPAPATRQRMESRNRSPQQSSGPVYIPAHARVLDRDGLLRSGPRESSPRGTQELFKELASMQYYRALSQLYINREISLQTYEHVGEKLIEAAYEGPPDGQAIRAISADVDAVARIGHLMSHFDVYMRDWVLSSCALAGARIPVCLIVAQLLLRPNFPAPPRWTPVIEKLAAEEFPPAMILHAKILGQRGKFNDAFTLLENKILPRISPQARALSPFEDMLLSGGIETPHLLYATLLRSYDAMYGSPESAKKAEEMNKIAALKYHDPNALADYACQMMDENNLDEYEDCMTMAATAGMGKPCLFLANFYYLTFLGRFPTRGERNAGILKPTTGPPPSPTSIPHWEKSKLKAFFTFVSSFFGQSLERGRYRDLAHEWYCLAWQHGERRALFMMALLDRENGYDLDGMVMLEHARMDLDPDYAHKLKALKDNWWDENYDPKLPKRMLDVR